MVFQAGQILNNRYRIVKLLGQGGFGAVYKAWDTKLNGPCAIKENFDSSPEAEKQFAREASILFNLRHPSLPRVFDHFSLSGQGQYLVMDYIEGEDLQEILNREGAPLPEAQVLPWIEQICDAIYYLHTQSPPIIHRDIKPANIKITPKGEAVLVDFGIAKIYDAQLKTTLGARAVTPGYSPPEQYGRGDTNPRTDIYALGATFYTALTGAIPPDSIDILAKKEPPPEPVRAFNLKATPVVEAAISRAMQLEEKLRFHSAADFKAAITGRGFTIVASPQASSVMMRTTAIPDESTWQVSEHTKKSWFQGMPKWLPWTGVAVVVIGCVFLVGIGLGTGVFKMLFGGAAGEAEVTNDNLPDQGGESSSSGGLLGGLFGSDEGQLTPTEGSGSVSGFGDKFTLEGQLGGNSYALDIKDNLAYLGVGPRIYVLDISDPSTPVFVGQSSVFPGVVRSVLVGGNYAYVAAGKGYLRILDISNPTQPMEVAFYQESGYAQGLALDGTILYIADNPHGLRVIDLSDPLNPRKLGELSLSSSSSSVAVSDDRVYLTGSSFGTEFEVIDVSDPSVPVVMGTVEIHETQGAMVQAVQVWGNYAYVAASSAGLVILDIRDPANPVKIGEYKTSWADGLVLEGNRLYLSDWVEGLYLLDITYPNNPTLVCFTGVKMSGQQIPGQRNMVARKEMLFSANINQGLTIVDYSNAACPGILSGYDVPLPGAAWDVFVEGDIGYVIEDMLGMFTLDVSKPDQPYQLGSDISTSRGGLRSPRAIISQGSLVYLVDINNGFSIYNVSDRTNPIELSQVVDPQGMTDIAVSGHFAYISLQGHGSGNQGRGFIIMDISNPAQPVQVSYTALDYGANTITVKGEYAFYPDMIEMAETGSPSSLRVFDISSPSNPLQVGAADLTNLAPEVFRIKVSEEYAFLGDFKNGLRIFDISDPAQPRLLGSLSTFVMVEDLVVVGDKVFTASYGCVNAIDISDPSHPILEAQIMTPGLSMGIYAIEDKVYIADCDGGLVILRYQE